MVIWTIQYMCAFAQNNNQNKLMHHRSDVMMHGKE